jgi:hypothetical protein
MKKYALVAVATLACTLAQPLLAAPPSEAESNTTTATQPAQGAQEALTSCLLSSTTDDDRRVLVQWIFLVMSRYPDVSSMVKVEDAERQRITKQAGGIFERLMVDNCGSELQLALRKSGTDAIGKSFEVLGQTAMSALLQHPAVNAESAAVMSGVDLDRFARSLKEK